MPYKKKTRARPKKKVVRKKTYRRNVNLNDTIQMNSQNRETYRVYLTPDATKVGSLTSLFQIEDVAATKSFPLHRILQDYSTNFSFKSSFRYWRVKSVSVRLIPELWIANNPDTVSATGDGEKPRIHFMRDAGQIQTYIDPTAAITSISVANAEKYGNKIYKSRQFTKPMTFTFKPFEYRQKDTLYSFNKWSPTNSTTPNIQLEGCYNLWYGFSNIPEGWKYKTEIQFNIVYKNPIDQ